MVSYVPVIIIGALQLDKVSLSHYMLKRWANTIRSLLESSYIIDYVDSNSTEVRPKGRVSWTTLFRSVVVYVFKEAEVIAKMEEKTTQSASAYSNRQTRKKVRGSHELEFSIQGCCPLQALALYPGLYESGYKLFQHRDLWWDWSGGGVVFPACHCL